MRERGVHVLRIRICSKNPPTIAQVLPRGIAELPTRRCLYAAKAGTASGTARLYGLGQRIILVEALHVQFHLQLSREDLPEIRDQRNIVDAFHDHALVHDLLQLSVRAQALILRVDGAVKHNTRHQRAFFRVELQAETRTLVASKRDFKRRRVLHHLDGHFRGLLQLRSHHRESFLRVHRRLAHVGDGIHGDNAVSWLDLQMQKPTRCTY